MVISQNVLTTEQHLKLGILESVSQLPKALPRILLQETKACVKGCTSPAFYRVITHLIHFIDNGKHIFCGHSGCDQRLVCVTEHCLCNSYFS